MKFSVLIPIYEKEKEKRFEECINSIINQTLKPNEIVIIKDGLLPQRLENVINETIKNNNLISIKTYQIEKNSGIGVALNIGVKLCENEYIARMDSDDIAVEDRFQKQVEYLEKHKDIDILGGAIEEYDENMEKIIDYRKVPIEDTQIKKIIKQRCPFNHPTVMYKKQKILEVGNYSSRRVMEDYELWIKCVKKGIKMHNLPDILLKNRAGNDLYRKRGGIKYIKNIIEIETLLYSLNIINIFEKWFNIFARSAVAMLPYSLRKIMYIKFLREEKY